MMSKGIINELNFVELFNNKIVKNLSKNAKELLYALFDNIDDNDIVICWKNKYLEKSDIKIKIKNNIKGISIKTGNECSMHQENKYKFYAYLNKIGVEEETIDMLDKFMIGKINNQKVDAKTYILNNVTDITKIKQVFNKYYIKNKLILRFIFQGTENQMYDCMAIIYGTPQNFIWATNSEVLQYLLKYENNVNYINISNLNIKCYDRNLKGNPKHEKKVDDIQVKWYSLKEDILYITKIREAEKLRTQNKIK